MRRPARWRLEPALGWTTRTGGEQPAQVFLLAAPEPAQGSLSVVARSAGRAFSAEAVVAVVEELEANQSNEGIPEPELVDQPAAGWRSRVLGGRWQVNVGHPEYREIAAQPAVKLRYLALLFAKEVVLRSGRDPRLESPLEQMVEVAAYADRKLAERRTRKRRACTV